MIACYYGGVETGGGWQLAILSYETGKVLRVLNPPNTYNAQIPPERPARLVNRQQRSFLFK